MILSTNLLSTPFISSTDSTRLQMAAKQIAQAVTHPNCQVPKVIGENWRYLTETCNMYRYQAPSDGEILYTNNDITILYLNFNGKYYLQILETPVIKHCSETFASKLRYKSECGKFNAGELLFEYDSFDNNLPTYGYNLNTLYMPWFGFNHEDSIVISKKTSELIKSTKIEKITILVNDNSLFGNIYENTSKYGFIPEIGQPLLDGVLTHKITIKAKYDSNQSILINQDKDLTTLIKSSYEPIISRIKNPIVADIKIHQINKSKKIIYPKLAKQIELIKHNYYSNIKLIYNQLLTLFSKEVINEILSKHYILTNVTNNEFKECCYVIEVVLVSENSLSIGDKLASRYANKGVIGMILPNELMPQYINTDRTIDIIINPISIFSRMIFGQIIENIVSKTILSAEESILKNIQSKDHIAKVLIKISKMAELFGNTEYAYKIIELAHSITTNDDVYNRFINSISQIGLYFEAPNFTNFQINELLKYIDNNFSNSNIIEPIRIKRETFKYMKQKLKLEIDIPNDDIIYNHLVSGPTYFLKLKHESQKKITCRDFGSYKMSNQQPIQGHQRGGGSSKLGQMEIDGLIASNIISGVKEIFTVKSDAKHLKHDLVSQILSTGSYNLPELSKSSYTKQLITSLIDTILPEQN